MQDIMIKIKKMFPTFIWIVKDAKKFIIPIIKILLLQVIYSLTGVAMAIVSKDIVDSATAGKMDNVIYYGIAFGCVIIVNLGASAITSMLSTKTLEGFSNYMRERMFARISRAEWISISQYHSGDILTRLTSDIGAVANGAISVLPSIISFGVQLIAAFVTLLYFEPYLALFAFVFGPLTILFSRIWSRKLKKLHIKIQEAESAYRSFIQESVENISIVKAFRMENTKVQKINLLHNNRMFWVLKLNKVGVTANTLLTLGYWVSYFIAFGWGALRLATKSITYGTLTAFLQLIGQIQSPFIGLSRTLPQVVQSLASAERLMELEKLEMENEGNKLTFSKSVGIKMKNVFFSYDKHEPVVKNISFLVKPGEIVALTGPSGEGKTTVIRLMLAFLKPESGSVIFTGTDGTEHQACASTRDWIAYVPQGNTLFSGTIADNLRSGYDEATEEELIEASKVSCAWEFIEKLPDGLNTKIGENGLGLSEGQAQRIALARAIIRKVPILILDESTSALDMNLETRVLESIRNLKPARSCLVITHRLSALQICSRVLKLKEGTIEEVHLARADGLENIEESAASLYTET